MEGEFTKEMKYSIIKQQLNKFAIDYSFASFKEFKKHVIDDDVEIIEHVKNNIDTEKDIDRVKTYTKQLIESCNDNVLCDSSVGSIYSTGLMQGVNFAFDILKENGLLRMSPKTI